MDMKISGAGAIGGGEYDKVAISGSAKAEGFIRCKELHCSALFPETRKLNVKTI